MGADVTSTLTVVMMGLATMIAIVGGYMLLSSAVESVSRGSAYNTFTRFTGIISNALSSTHASATNLYLTPKYVIFAASFPDEIDVSYFIFDGQRMNHVAVNQKEAGGLFKQVVESSSGDSFYNNGSASREELKKCVNDACICLGETTTLLLLEPEYFKANACVDICWGEDPATYDQCLTSNDYENAVPREILKTCNELTASKNGNVLCKRCWDYVKNYDTNLELMEESGYNVLGIKVNSLDQPNQANYQELVEFTNAVKYSFIPNVIECVPMSEIATSAGKSSYCATGTNPIPYLLNYIENEGEKGVFAILSTSQKTAQGTPLEEFLQEWGFTPSEEDITINDNNIMFELFNMEYYQDSTIQPSVCYAWNSYVKTEVKN